MADLFKNVFGGSKDGQAAAPAAGNPDSDFADFAGAPDPVPEPEPAAGTGTDGAAAAAAQSTAVPWTKWYNVHERHSLSEFKAEGVILAVGLVILVLHMIGARANRRKARAWIRAHGPALTAEYALVGFSGVPTIDRDDVKPDDLLKEKSLFEFATYATGRQNVAFADIKLTLSKRFNPLVNMVETIAAFLFESTFETPTDSMEAFIYPFDGKEDRTVPSLPGAAEIRAKDSKSSYDSFVWAVVNKTIMHKVRDERYDLSLTSTKDNPRLPNWLTVMSESAEITDALLTPELAAAIEAAGDDFQFLIVTDQPTEKPKSLDETLPSKRVLLKYRLPSSNDYTSLAGLFTYFLRLPDRLVQSAHFRPEVVRKVRATRDAMSKELRKAAEEEKAEERLLEKEKAKKAKRDAELAALDAKAQKKYLEKEREKEMRKSAKKQTVRG
ncbi:hypothetical protein ACRE_002560 [Hapsidospora chrysogenum ATCC 11550]|uniref:Uncharacterized protein n=1 Tax=Hapsidospora chrysogenum (strain ATCC 11550 / CBS 779.69 / DSM 880 / IAM 14645 / JCM 23072 / IMI 49137) TaxID=857340 RepID=A0A086THX1_HAPC1|nr:hypothetical protein ACRE_002560 [Hapsidospora chrysogenum ATCC 11550]